MTLQQLSYIVELSKCSSMNKAAQKLYLSQTALSSAIKALEDELGTELIVRSNRGVEFTPLGREFVGRAASLLEQQESLLDMFTGADSKPRPSRLSVSGQRFSFVEDALIKYRLERDDGHFSLTYNENNMTAVIDDVYNRIADLGVISVFSNSRRMTKKLLDSRELEFHEIIRTEPCVFMSADSPMADAEVIDEEELKKYTYVYYPREEGSPIELAEEYRMYSGFLPVKTICCNTCGTVLSMLARTDAYTIGSGILVPGIAPNVYSRPLSDEKTICIGYIVRKREKPTGEMEQFIRLMRAGAASCYEYTLEVRKRRKT